MKKNKEIKVCLVGSSGGHLTHLYMLKPFWKDKEHFWVTFDKEDAKSLLEKRKKCILVITQLIEVSKPLLKIQKLLGTYYGKKSLNLIISCGAAVAVPFFILEK